MDEGWVIRLNIERYRRMLQAEVDEVARRTIQKMLDEFEAKLSSTYPSSKSGSGANPQQSPTVHRDG